MMSKSNWSHDFPALGFGFVCSAPNPPGATTMWKKYCREPLLYPKGGSSLSEFRYGEYHDSIHCK